MSKLTDKNLAFLIDFEEIVDDIYYPASNAYKAIMKLKDPNYVNIKRLYNKNIKLYEIINKFNLNLFDFYNPKTREDVKTKYGEKVYDLVKKIQETDFCLQRVLTKLFIPYKNYFSLEFDKKEGKWFITNLPDNNKAEVSNYLFSKSGELIRPINAYKKLKKDFNLVEFDLNSLKEPYKEITSVIVDRIKNSKRIYGTPQVLYNVEIRQLPIDTSDDWLTDQHSETRGITCGEEIHLLFGSKKIVIPLPGEFSSIDWFNYVKVTSNKETVECIFDNEEYKEIFDRYGNVEEEIINRYVSEDGDYDYIRLNKPIEYKFKDNIVKIDKIMYYEDSTIEIQPIAKEKNKVEFAYKL